MMNCPSTGQQGNCMWPCQSTQQPGAPVWPSQPYQPCWPYQPNQANWPGMQPSVPNWPAYQPAQPPQSVWPSPSQPIQPNQLLPPGQPNQPFLPSQPMTPSQPSQPMTPSQPFSPSQPMMPSQPMTPSQPNQPMTPSQPISPSQPMPPSQPVPPNQPMPPNQPIQPVPPGQAIWPSQLPSPSSPSWHGNPGQPGWPNQGSTGVHQYSWPPVPYTAPVSVPFNMNFPRGIYDKLMLTIRGQVKPDAKMFTVNFVQGNDIALHINPRFNERGKQVLVRNHKLGDQWGPEERSLLAPFPFAAGQHFEMKILCTTEEFKVAVNNTPVFDFKHRIREVNQIDRINILHDVILTSVNVDTLP
ncbi:galectin-3 isoform X1 [Clarias gariepinus]|uniref:galectin-3 isoform X1 n=1 Tax=Clarias gariepinus TaxID=13013 RepID=UPI00234D1886|nr:galectin-3 isoform X1 [Clarias gariepinus]